MKDYIKVAVTGGAGFLGNSLVEFFNNTEKIVPFSIDKKTHVHLDADTYHMNINHRERLIEIFNDEDADCVVHTAAPTNIGNSVSQPAEFVPKLMKPAINVLEASAKTDVSRVVNISSAHVYGEYGRRWVSEDMMKSPDSPYAAAKLAVENVMESYNTMYPQLQLVNVRPSTLFGANMPSHMLIPELVSKASSDGDVIVRGTGENTRCYTHVNDVCDGIYRCVVRGGLDGQAFNIGSASPLTIKEVAEIVVDEVDEDKDIYFHGETFKGDTRHIMSDITKAMSVIDYTPKIPPKAGIREYVKEKIDD